MASPPGRVGVSKRNPVQGVSVAPIVVLVVKIAVKEIVPVVLGALAARAAAVKTE